MAGYVVLVSVQAIAKGAEVIYHGFGARAPV